MQKLKSLFKVTANALSLLLEILDVCRGEKGQRVKSLSTIADEVYQEANSRGEAITLLNKRLEDRSTDLKTYAVKYVASQVRMNKKPSITMLSMSLTKLLNNRVGYLTELPIESKMEMMYDAELFISDPRVQRSPHYMVVRELPNLVGAISYEDKELQACLNLSRFCQAQKRVHAHVRMVLEDINKENKIM